MKEIESYTITVTKQYVDKGDNNYSGGDNIYEQVVSDISLVAIIEAVNNPDTWKPNTALVAASPPKKGKL